MLLDLLVIIIVVLFIIRKEKMLKDYQVTNTKIKHYMKKFFFKLILLFFLGCLSWGKYMWNKSQEKEGLIFKIIAVIFLIISVYYLIILILSLIEKKESDDNNENRNNLEK
jgi:uncharacterized membrane protein